MKFRTFGQEMIDHPTKTIGSNILANKNENVYFDKFSRFVQCISKLTFTIFACSLTVILDVLVLVPFGKFAKAPFGQRFVEFLSAFFDAS